MHIEYCPVISVDTVGDNIYEMTFRSEVLASSARAGQFVNIKVNETAFPLLRRPFSIYKIENDFVKIIFNVIGVGTSILASKRKGDVIDVLGVLGKSYDCDEDFETAILVGGGLGVAPLPMLTDALKGKKTIATFLGARTKGQLVETYLEHVHHATEDGSKGFKGTVIELLRKEFHLQKFNKPKMFACGPNGMLQSLSAFAKEMNIPCEVSLESTMACGIGLCQGCPIKLANDQKTYALICKEGPVFNASNIVIE